MKADEQTRQRVYARLLEVLGEEAAATLMSDLPPFPWSEVATKADLATLGDALRGDMGALRSELRGEMSELRGDMGALRSEMSGEMSELRGDMGELRGDMGQMEGRLSMAMAAQARHFTTATIGAVLTTGALAFAAAGLT